MSKPWEMDRYDAKANYDFMRQHFSRCWACFSNSKPKNYLGPWLIERAHVFSHPRREDRRVVIMLCSICHKVGGHRERVVGFLRPTLSQGMMMGLKLEFDPNWYDLEFMQKHSTKRLPEIEPLPEKYLELRQINKPTRKKRG